MNSPVLEKPEAAGGCGSGSCGCGSAAIDRTPAAVAVPEVRVNGRPLHIGPDEDLETVRERAWGEVLRQEAVRQGLLADVAGELAPTLSAEQVCIRVVVVFKEPKNKTITFHLSNWLFWQNPKII